MNKRSAAKAAILTRMWAAEAPLHAIAKALGMGKTTTAGYRLHLGLPNRSPRLTRGELWTAAEIAEVQRRWNIGHSGGEIAKDYPGRTRNAVIGVIERNGSARPATPQRSTTRLPRVPRANVAAKPRAPKTPVSGASKPFKGYPVLNAAETAKRQAAAAEAGIAALRKAAEPANDKAILLMDRRRSQCAWPVGEPDRPATQLCCGQTVDRTATATTTSYCERHRMIAAPAGVPCAKGLNRLAARAA